MSANWDSLLGSLPPHIATPTFPIGLMRDGREKLLNPFDYAFILVPAKDASRLHQF